MQKINLKSILFMLTLVFILIMAIYGVNQYYSIQTPHNKFETVNVLIYNGEGTSTDSVEGMIYCLEQANQNNPNVYFNYTTNDVINSDVLSPQDVLVISGGDITLLFNDPDINPGDIKKFVEEGKGYLGICAGSYAASNYEGEYGSGWGISPHINCTYTDYEGALPLTLTTYGVKTLQYPEGKTTSFSGLFSTNKTDPIKLPPFPMFNTPALYKNGNYTPIAIYANNNTVSNDTANNDAIFKNYAAILDDTSGSGRIILSGPHPELNPTEPELIARMILWVSKRI
jgi:glutamine amidotransferase-like uncharacterized protein